VFPALHIARAPKGHGSTHVRIFHPPPGDPRCQVVLQGAMGAELADLLVRLFRLGARALGLPLTESGRTRHPPGHVG
jgi:hypothetical protein